MSVETEIRPAPPQRFWLCNGADGWRWKRSAGSMPIGAPHPSAKAAALTALRVLKEQANVDETEPPIGEFFSLEPAAEALATGLVQKACSRAIPIARIKGPARSPTERLLLAECFRQAFGLELDRRAATHQSLCVLAWLRFGELMAEQAEGSAGEGSPASTEHQRPRMGR